MSFILLGILNSQAAGAVAGGGSYDLLETTVLDSDTASVSFTGLGSYSDYKHLQVRTTVRTNRGSTVDFLQLNFNSDTSASYSRHALRGNGSSVISFASTSQTFFTSPDIPAASDTANAFGAIVFDILDFSSTSKNTTVRQLGGTSSSPTIIELHSGLYFKTDAITSLAIEPANGTNLVTGSRFSLYGFKETV